MPLSLDHTIHPEYLLIEIKGRRVPQQEFEEMLILWKKIFHLAREYDQTKIMALLNIKGRIPVRARVNLLFNLKEMGWERRYRIAAVPLTSQVNTDVKIVEQFMDRIGYNARLFTKEVDALIWLLGDAVASESKKDIYLND